METMESCNTLEELLSQMRKVDFIFEKSNSGKISFSQISEALGEIMNANVYMISAKGKVLGTYFKNEEDSFVIPALTEAEEDNAIMAECIAETDNFDLLKVEETVSGENGFDFFPSIAQIPENQHYGKPHMIVPIYHQGMRVGTFMFARYGEKFDIQDMILAEHVAVIIGAELDRRRRKAVAEKQRKIQEAQLALEGLTGSERMIIEDVFLGMESDTALVVASKIADQAKIARTQMASALRKLEVAGIIEVHSFGSKGTQIHVLNPRFRELLQKPKKSRNRGLGEF